MFSAAAGMSLMLASTAAEAKASKAAVHYRDYPSGMRMCHMCKFYMAVGGGRSGMGCMGGSMMGMMGELSGCRGCAGPTWHRCLL